MESISAFTGSAAQVLQPLSDILMLYYSRAHIVFNERTANIHFGGFCIVYSLIFLWVVMKCTKPKPTKWRPVNKQLKTLRQKYTEKFYSTLFSLPIISGIVGRRLQSKLEKQEQKLISILKTEWDKRRTQFLPDKGMSNNDIEKMISQWKKHERQIEGTGKISGSFYCADTQLIREVNEFAAPYMYQNPLHLDTYKEVIKMEKELLNMTADLITQTGCEYYGTVTSGGSESLILAMLTYRKYYNKSKPNIVVPVSAHAALDKGGFYLNIELRKAKLNSKFEVDIQHMKSLIDGNTIMLVGSVPNYPHGIVDPIDEIAKLAIKHKVAFHVDGCLGGFVGPFDEKLKGLYSLDRKGVTSISLDQHKFALAPKGIGSIFYKTKELRHSQYYVYTEWSGGLYSTTTFAGSRSGLASAASWYALVKTTKKGLKQNAKCVIEATKTCAKNLSFIPQIELFGTPEICVIAFTSKQPKIPISVISDLLKKKNNWNLSLIHKPLGIHISVTMANFQAVMNELHKDVRQAIKEIRSNKQVKKSTTSALYGVSGDITENMEIDFLKYLLSASMK